MSRLNSQLWLVAALLCCSSNASALTWDDLWKRNDQQVNDLLQSEAFDQASERADTVDQQALVKYRAGEYAESADLYNQSNQHYNRGTSLLQAGEFDQAIEAFDQILSDSGEYQDAMHNRKIAQKLAELQQQQQNESGDGEGEQGDENQPSDQSSDSNGQGSDSSENSSPDSAQQPSNQGESGDSSDQQSDQQDEQQPEGDDSESGEESSEGEQQEGQERKGSPESATHDEKQQAMDQWLQRVPDDPAGLLRARIVREHQRNYGNSRDQEQAW